MSSEEPFGPWVEPMERAGARDPRSTTGRLSWGGLARKAAVSTSAVTNMVYGRTRPNPATVQKVAEALGESPQTISEWLKLSRPVGDRYVPDGSAALLYDHERAALDELIRAITRDRREEGDSGGDTAPTSVMIDEEEANGVDLRERERES